jgi:hypothetical protein
MILYVGHCSCRILPSERFYCISSLAVLLFFFRVLAHILAYMAVGLFLLISPNCLPLLYLYKTYFPIKDVIPFLIPFLLASHSKNPHEKWQRREPG